MSQENVEFVRQSMEALLRRDRDAWLAIHDEEFEIVPVRDWPEGAVRGRETGWDFRHEDPRQASRILRVQWFTDRAEALEAAGLSE